jgi:hypothetical protein
MSSGGVSQCSQKCIEVSKEYAASIFRIEELTEHGKIGTDTGRGTVVTEALTQDSTRSISTVAHAFTSELAVALTGICWIYGSQSDDYEKRTS